MQLVAIEVADQARRIEQRTWPARRRGLDLLAVLVAGAIAAALAVYSRGDSSPSGLEKTPVLRQLRGSAGCLKGVGGYASVPCKATVRGLFDAHGKRNRRCEARTSC